MFVTGCSCWLTLLPVLCMLKQPAELHRQFAEQAFSSTKGSHISMHLPEGCPPGSVHADVAMPIEPTAAAAAAASAATSASGRPAAAAAPATLCTESQQR